MTFIIPVSNKQWTPRNGAVIWTPIKKDPRFIMHIWSGRNLPVKVVSQENRIHL